MALVLGLRNRVWIALAAALSAGVSALPAETEVCAEWSAPETVGLLDTSFLPEASGMAFSRRFPDRLYHINDSGGGPYFYLTDYAGRGTEQVPIRGFDETGQDTEDLAVGPCGGRRHCLFVGAIGDNYLVRPTVEVLVIRERRRFKRSAKVKRTLTMRYPDGPHNAESLAVHTNGDIYILEKTRSNVSAEPRPARLYRLPRKVWKDPSQEPYPLELAGVIDLPFLAEKKDAPGSAVATAIDISADGERLLVLTMEYAWEFGVDLSDGDFPPAEQLVDGETYSLICVKTYWGQETIAYLPDGSGFLYGKEFKDDQQPPVLVRLRCLRPE